jgi:hypothetical protein
MANETTFSTRHMTHVILSNGIDEKHISFPTTTDFPSYLKAIRSIEPDRRWEITEAWDR